MSQPSAERRGWAQLLAVVLAALALPALLVRLPHDDAADDPRPGGSEDDFNPTQQRQRLAQARPDWVLIGNSMLNSRVDPAPLGTLSGLDVRKLGRSRTQLAIWWLFFKHIVVESGARPRVVTFFFRDSDLSWPEYRTDGANADLIAELSGSHEPEWDEVLGWRDDTGRGPAGWLRAGSQELFPAEAWRKTLRQDVQDAAFWLTPIGDVEPGLRRVELNELFSLTHLRRDLGDDGSASAAPAPAADMAQLPDPGMYDGAPMKFDPSPRATFLPHMLALARQHGIRLHFHRVKRRPLPDGTRPDSRLLQTYMRDLRAWLEPQGAAFTDESADPAITLDWYADGDHVAKEKKSAYAANFWQRTRFLFAP